MPELHDGTLLPLRGTRAVDELFAAWLAIRPGIVDGTMLSPSVQLPGVLRPVVFRARLARP